MTDRKCMRIDCDRKATNAVKVVVPDVLSDETSAEGLIGIELCDDHIHEAKAWEFSAWGVFKSMIGHIATPGTEPAVEEAYVEGVPIGGMEHQAFLNSGDPPPN